MTNLKQNTYTNREFWQEQCIYVSCRFTCNMVSFRSHLRVSWGWYWSSYVMLIGMCLKAHLAFEVLYEWLCILSPANRSFLRPFNTSKRLLHRLAEITAQWIIIYVILKKALLTIWTNGATLRLHRLPLRFYTRSLHFPLSFESNAPFTGVRKSRK